MTLSLLILSGVLLVAIPRVAMKLMMRMYGRSLRNPLANDWPHRLIVTPAAILWWADAFWFAWLLLVYNSN